MTTKQPKHRFSNRVIDLEPGMYAVRFVEAARRDAASVTISVVPGANGTVQMLGDIDGGTGMLQEPGSVLVVRTDKSVQLLATIMARIDILKPNVRIDVERLDGKKGNLATGPVDASGETHQSLPAIPAAVSDNPAPALLAPAPTPASPSSADGLASRSWMRWDERPAQVMLSMAVAQTPATWSPPRLAEDVDIGALGKAWGFRWALVGPGRQEWQLQAKAYLADGTLFEATGQNVVVPSSFGDELRAASLFVRRGNTGDWVTVLEWHKEAARAA